METIYAVSSAAGRAGVAVIRVSGDRAGAAVRALTGAPPGPPRQAQLRRLADPDSGAAIDRALCLWFAAPASFTGEDVAEFHVHGGSAVVAATLAALGRCPGLVPAEAGAFSRRAFEHGKLDLTAAEGLADLIAAETEGQRRAALRQMDGALGTLYEAWRARLTRALAHLEAAIDFPDEALPADLAARLRPDVAALAGEVGRHLADGHRGERLREGVRVAIVGPPNVGKSSLLNWLAGRDVAIVSAEAGTTRDVLEVRLDLGGVPVLVADTAGLRAAEGAIEQEGVRRARARAAAADIRLVLAAATAEGGVTGGFAEAAPGDLAVLNKIDLAGDTAREAAEKRLTDINLFPVSVTHGQGLEALLSALGAAVVAAYGVSEAPVLTRARHRAGLEACAEALERALAALDAAAPPELAAEDLRLASRALGRITGRVDVEDLLDIVFRDFCIGK